MRWKKFVRYYLHFSRRERMGIIILWILIVLVWAVPIIIDKIIPPQPPVDFSQAKKIANILDSVSHSRQTNFTNYSDTKNTHHKKPDSLFDFNPNTLSVANWQKLGLPDNIISIIQHYLKKGGHFYKKQDLQKIYGLSDKEYQRLAPFIHIPKEQKQQIVYQKDSSYQQTTYKKVDRYKQLTIEINSADSEQFKQLHGIGAVLSARIVHFREILGGFYSIDQLKQVYHLPDSVFQKIKPHLTIDTSAIEKININTADVYTLEHHPYINYNLANAIVNYRTQHGPFTSLQQLHHIALVNDEIYRKIVHYLVVN